MARKKKRKSIPPERPGALQWSFDPDIPTDEFFEGPLTVDWQLEEAVENFIDYLENDRFLTWEAVAAHEQGVPLTVLQENALDALISFGDPDDDRILYIDEIARPSEPWYVILGQIAAHLLIEPLDTSEVPTELMTEGWPLIQSRLKKKGEGLSLPRGATSYKDIVPMELGHKLWLQTCFDPLLGLGQGKRQILEETDPERIDDLLGLLRKHKESVDYLGLSLESMLTHVILPERDRPVFIRMMQQRLGLTSVHDPIAPRL